MATTATQIVPTTVTRGSPWMTGKAIVRLSPVTADVKADCVIASNSSTRGATTAVTYAADDAGTVHFRLALSTASAVAVVPVQANESTEEVTVHGTPTTARPSVVLRGQADGTWAGTGRFPVGLHAVLLLVDGRIVLSPHLSIGHLHNGDLVNFIDVPPPAHIRCCYVMQSRHEHGSVSQDYVNSFTTDAVEKILVYLPPSYHHANCATRRYTVLYLLHDDRTSSTGCLQLGKVNIIADNLIADGRMGEMIIVMKSHVVGCEEEESCPSLHQLCDDIVDDIVPYIDNRYRTLADRDNRAIAGLSMGSMQATRLSVTRQDLFSAVGIFSGFMRSCWSSISTNDDHIDVLRRDPSAYQSAMKVLFRCIGDSDVHLQRFEEDDVLLDELDLTCTRRIYSGPHSWHVWRQAAPDFLSMIFK